MKNTLSSRVYNKLYIVLFRQVVDTLSTVRVERATIVVVSFLFYYLARSRLRDFTVQKKSVQILYRLFTVLSRKK